MQGPKLPLSLPPPPCALFRLSLPGRWRFCWRTALLLPVLPVSLLGQTCRAASSLEVALLLSCPQPLPVREAGSGGRLGLTSPQELSFSKSL